MALTWRNVNYAPNAAAAATLKAGGNAITNALATAKEGYGEIRDRRNEGLTNEGIQQLLQMTSLDQLKNQAPGVIANMPSGVDMAQIAEAQDRRRKTLEAALTGESTRAGQALSQTHQALVNENFDEKFKGEQGLVRARTHSANMSAQERQQAMNLAAEEEARRKQDVLDYHQGRNVVNNFGADVFDRRDGLQMLDQASIANGWSPEVTEQIRTKYLQQSEKTPEEAEQAAKDSLLAAQTREDEVRAQEYTYDIGVEQEKAKGKRDYSSTYDFKSVDDIQRMIDDIYESSDHNDYSKKWAIEPIAGYDPEKQTLTYDGMDYGKLTKNQFGNAVRRALAAKPDGRMLGVLDQSFDKDYFKELLKPYSVGITPGSKVIPGLNKEITVGK